MLRDISYNNARRWVPMRRNLITRAKCLSDNYIVSERNRLHYYANYHAKCDAIFILTWCLWYYSLKYYTQHRIRTSVKAGGDVMKKQHITRAWSNKLNYLMFSSFVQWKNKCHTVRILIIITHFSQVVNFRRIHGCWLHWDLSDVVFEWYSRRCKYWKMFCMHYLILLDRFIRPKWHF